MIVAWNAPEVADVLQILGDRQVGVQAERLGEVAGVEPRLARRPGMTIDDQPIDVMPRELVGEHQAGGAGTDDQDIALLGKVWHGGARGSAGEDSIQRYASSSAFLE